MVANVSVPRVSSDADVVLRAVTSGTAAAVGSQFFRELVRKLADVLGVRYAFASEFCGASRSRVRTLAFWFGDHFIDDIEYDLAHTPCEAVLAGEIRCYPTGVAALFPQETELVAMQADSYLAVPLTKASGDVLGHLAVIDVRPMQAQPRDLSVFRLFGMRAGAELERLRAERALRESNQRLSALLGTVADAVLLLDESGRVLFSNPSAEAVLGCPADRVVGRDFGEFSGASMREFLTGVFGAAPDASPARHWLPEGALARRADGGEFPVEGSVAVHEQDGRPRYTLVLRDLGERLRAENARRRLELERDDLVAELGSGRGATGLITQSAGMRQLLSQLEKVAATDASVLILGETGTGKELVARALHEQSPRRSGPLVKLNCGALPAELIESELFGHEKGSFTGATARRIGRFELADGGTLFLDEVGELTAAAQVRLLRVLQEREFERVGGSKTLRVDVRVVAATHRPLERLVEAGTFRQDLYYRLAVFPLELPPLRERRRDVPPLAMHFAEAYAKRMNRAFSGIAAESLRALSEYDWPGNVRELQNVIERALILADEGPLVISDRAIVRRGEMSRTQSGTHRLESVGADAAGDPGAIRSLEEVERDHLRAALEATRWTVEGPRGAAQRLRLKPSTLRFRMRKLGISKP